MKKIFFVIVFAFFALALNAQIKSANLQASGLTCSMCSNSIFKSLKKVSFVESVESDVEASTFKIIFKSNENVDPDALQKAVTDAGFSIAKLTFVLSINQVDLKEKTPIEIDQKLFYFINTQNKVLNGQIELRLLDKGFVSPKEYKKIKSKLYSNGEKRVFNVDMNI